MSSENVNVSFSSAQPLPLLPSDSDHGYFSAEPSAPPSESSPLCGEKLPQGPPPSYTSTEDLKSSGNLPRTYVTTQPEKYQQQQQRPRTTATGPPQNQYAPTQAGCCELTDDACTICVCCFFLCECCLALHH